MQTIEFDDCISRSQCCAAGLDGVVFARNGGAEERHNAVTARLIDQPIVLMHGVHQPLEHWANNFQRFFWVQLVDEFGRPLDVGKQDGDTFALAQHGCAGPHDTLSEFWRDLRLQE
jgi:hypothetical protein